MERDDGQTLAVQVECWDHNGRWDPCVSVSVTRLAFPDASSFAIAEALRSAVEAAVAAYCLRLDDGIRPIRLRLHDRDRGASWVVDVADG